MQNSNIKIITTQDWSKIENNLPINVNLAKNFEQSDIEQMGIYIDNGDICTSSFVGVRKLKDINGKNIIIEENGINKEIVLNITPRFKINQWTMLTTVLQDDEYEKYVNGMENKFFKIYYEEGTITTDVDVNGGELILIISFLRACQSLCRRQLKTQMGFLSENLHGSVRGSISISEHIKKNVMLGREDRIFCRYPVFTVDTLENRIIKKALFIVSKIFNTQSIELPELKTIMTYCKSSLKNVKLVDIKKSDFHKINITGFNSYYKKPIELAKLVLLHCGMNVNPEDSNITRREVIPYVIKIETLFEYYVRAKIKEYLSKKKILDFKIDEYRHPRDPQALRSYEVSQGMTSFPYLMNEYIPDIAFMKKFQDTWKYVAVFDVKYQRSTKNVFASTRRYNSHQIMFYMLLLSVNKCGFIFPVENEESTKSLKCDLLFQNGNVDKENRYYSQWEVNGNGDVDEVFDELIKYVIS
ncbi:5-methylcytosine restriction system specificity protein McrC [Clostridium butyricum]|uniref:5-methylcytosine restriction system specificity protein McrC n=1 Tax=Clostridium butyricum TaxID=1492 RepID=UPI003D337E9A